MRKPIVAAIGGAVVAVLASFLPWLRSGTVERSGFNLARDAWGAGLTDVELGKAFLVAWLLTPVLTAGAWTAASVGLRRPAGALAGATGLIAGVAAVAVLASDVKPLVGVMIALFGGVVAFLGGIWLMWARRRADE